MWEKKRREKKKGGGRSQGVCVCGGREVQRGGKWGGGNWVGEEDEL